MDMQQVLKLLLANQVKANANRKTDRKERKGDQEDLKRMLSKMKAKMDGNQAETRSIFVTWLKDLKDCRNETTACNEATKIEPNPGMMQSIEEHQEIPKGEAAVMPLGEPRKRRKVCNLAAERPPKRK
jgi:hypothetical protein